MICFKNIQSRLLSKQSALIHAVIICAASFLSRIIDASDRIEASRISDIRKALRYDTDQKLPVVSDVHVSLRVARQLRFAAALSRKETEGDHFTLP